jgi:photosystem II stability/assembly factor-like uncharacterized protein
VYARDFDLVGPYKLLPGVVGRSRWFAQRAGDHEHALSLKRLQRGLSDAETMDDAASLQAQVLEEAHSLLAVKAKTTRERTLRRPSLLDSAGRASALTAISPSKRDGITAASTPLETEEGGILLVPIDERVAGDLDLETVIVAEISDPRQPVINDTFTYWPQEGVVVGRIPRGGQYQVFALPKDPLLRVTFDALARHWKWVERDPLLRELTGRRGTIPQAEVINRICQVILSGPEYDHLDPGPDRIEMPPGESAVLGGFEVSGASERINRLLGDIDIVDGALFKPPVIKWWWDFFPRCSRWISIGPVPDSTFRGIGRVSQIAVHPSNGNILIAGAAGGGVWRTSNGGASWAACMELQPTLTMGAVAIAISNPSIMYAASGEDGGGFDPAWSGVGIYRSSNGGSTWTLMTPVPSTRFSAIVVHPKHPDVVYVGGNRGLHKSINGGVTWRTNPGLESLFDGQITDVVIGYEEPVVETTALDLPPLADLNHFPPPPFNAERVYIGVRNDGVYRSTSAGEQFWSPAFTRLDGSGQLPAGSAVGWTKLAIGRRGAHRSAFLAAKLGPDGSRIFTTVDGGTTWTEKAVDVARVGFDEWCSVVAVDPSDENVMYAGAAGALKRTTNGGATAADWTSINAGIHSDQQDIAFDPLDSRRIFLANDGGVFRSTDRGTNWTLASGRLAITQLYDIDVSETDRDIVAGGAQDNGIYYRNGSGVWRNIPWGDGTQVAIDSTDPQIFYFSSQNGLPSNLRRSVDGGASHQQVGQIGLSGGSPWITIIKLDPRHPIANPAGNRVVFVCGDTELFRSSNGGQIWQRVEDGSGNPFQSSGEITALEFAPSDPAILYLATSSGAVYRAVNGGSNAADWTRIDTPGSPADALFPTSRVQAIRVNPANPNHVWLVFGGSGVSFTGRPDMILNPLGISHLFRNTDATNINGWMDASGQFPALNLPDVPTSATALVDFDPLVAYAGTDVGVFRTTDGGVTWTAYQDGLPRSPVVELRFNRRFNRLFAATMGRGVYIRDV